jgi:hypothetical protein
LKKAGPAYVSMAVLTVVSWMQLSCGSSTPVQPDPKPSPTAPTLVPPVGSFTCPLGNGSPTATCTRRGYSYLLSAVDAAIDRVVAKKPEIFVLGHESSPRTRQYEILDKTAYFTALLGELHDVGFCAERDYDRPDLVNVKNEAGSSERFAVYQTLGVVGYILHNAYQQTCTPADFPVAPDPNGPPAGSGCGKPYPPAVGHFNLNETYMTLGPVWTLDSTPIVTYDKEYCASVGFTDGRIHCAFRVDWSDERRACENWRVGDALDTGLPGPTWTRNGQYCTGLESGCAHHPENPYQILVYENGSGHYRVCAANGVCGEGDVTR